MKRSWIKLYVEVLDDVKLGPLPVWLRWRFIELLLVAAESDQSGILPSVKQTAWRLRVSEADLLKSLRSLSDSGVMCEQGERWKVTNFEKRQASLTEAERASGYRSRKRQGSVAAAVTESDAVVVTDSSSTSTSTSPSSSDSDSEGVRVQGEGEPEVLQGSAVEVLVPGRDVLQAYQANIGLLTPLVAQALLEDEQEYGTEWVLAAIQEAVANEARNLKYAQAILKRWKRDGFRVDRKQPRLGKGQTMQDVKDMLQDWLEQEEQ